jgi:hypothetical protein
LVLFRFLFRGFLLSIIAAKLEQVIEGRENISRVAIVDILGFDTADGRDQLFGCVLFGFLLAILVSFLAIVGMSPETEEEETGMSRHYKATIPAC